MRWGAIAAVLGAVALSPAGGSALLGETLPKDWAHRDFLAFGGLWSLLVLGALHGKGPLSWALSTRALRAVGVFSFSVYLWHVPVARSIVLLNLSNPLVITWLVVATSLGAGVLSFSLFEWPLTRSKPVTRWFARLIAR